jgi:hypothetical protein
LTMQLYCKPASRAIPDTPRLTSLGSADTRRDNHLDPQTYYEHVAPSNWKPPEGDSCLALYRRAYCGYGDAALPPLYFAIVGAICYWQLLPLWGLLLTLLPLLGFGIHFLVFKGKPTL